MDHHGGIPLMNVGDLPKMDPCKEVAQQRQAHLLLPAYVPDPTELDEHVPIYAPDPEHPEHHVPSDDDIQAEDQPYAEDASLAAKSPGYITDSDLIKDDTDANSIDYPDNENSEEDDNEDPEEDPNKKHVPKDDEEDPEEDPSKEDEPFEDSNDTEPFEEDETAATPPSPGRRRAMITAPLGHKAAMIRRRDDIPEEDMTPRRIFVLTAPPPGYDVAESSAAAARAPRGPYDFVDTLKAGQGLIHSPGHEARTIARAADRAEDVGYTDRRDIRLEIDVVRGQRTAYEIELHEDLSAKIKNNKQIEISYDLAKKKYRKENLNLKILLHLDIQVKSLGAQPLEKALRLDNKLFFIRELDALRLDNKLFFIRELNSHESDWINSVASTLISSQPPCLLQSPIELWGLEFP
ncbi:hypothetical protein Tco_0508826 [Tanacetum coccineum]